MRKDANQSQRPNHEERLGTREEEAQVGGQHGEKVDNPIETPSVTEWPGNADQPSDVLDREQDGDCPFRGQEEAFVGLVNLGDAVEHDNHDADHDGDQEGNIEGLSGGRVGLEDHFVHAPPPRREWVVVRWWGTWCHWRAIFRVRSGGSSGGDHTPANDRQQGWIPGSRAWNSSPDYLRARR